MTVQHYAAYTAEDHEVWSLLYKRQKEAIYDIAYRRFSASLSALGMSDTAIPDFELLDRRLRELTRWSIYAVPGLIDNKTFFHLMHFRRFGATIWLRKREELDYLEEPDMFHDVFGHVPLLADPMIAAFLFSLAVIAVRHTDSERAIERIARLYWYTIEFGLVREKGRVKIYGAGILSSIGESKFCLSPQASLVPFDLERILETPYIKDHYQAQYFVLEDMRQLGELIPLLERYL